MTTIDMSLLQRFDCKKCVHCQTFPPTKEYPFNVDGCVHPNVAERSAVTHKLIGLEAQTCLLNKCKGNWFVEKT